MPPGIRAIREPGGIAEIGGTTGSRDMGEKKQILIVEDDAALNNGLVLSLKNDDYHIEQAFNIAEAKKQLDGAGTFDLILLDINLPDGSGLELCREIRKTRTVPIIFLTANDMEVDVVSGFETGGDDYVTKPFSLAVLRARVAALLRRGEQKAESDGIVIDGFVFDFERMAFSKNGRELALSKTEQKLLRLLVYNRGSTLSRDLLMEKVWGDGSEYVDVNALSVTISRLRGKLEDDPSSPAYIQTIYGVGYTWAVKKHE
jgi:two-component system response regulator RegX3